jgi:hypothetical protein
MKEPLLQACMTPSAVLDIRQNLYTVVETGTMHVWISVNVLFDCKSSFQNEHYDKEYENSRRGAVVKLQNTS